jgi:hypothetical protein
VTVRGRWLLKLRAGMGDPRETPLRRSSSKASRVPEHALLTQTSKALHRKLDRTADALNRLVNTITGERREPARNLKITKDRG